jgi:Protein of unknown function (DUF3108)
MHPRRIFALALAASLYAFALSPVGLAKDTPKERTPAAKPAPSMPFESSEQLVYEGEFSKMLLRGIKIAELRFKATRGAAATTTPTTPTDATATTAPTDATATTAQADAQPSIVPPQIQLTSDIESKGWFRKLFGINFRYHVETTVDAGTFSALRTSKVDEQGKRVRTSEAVFDQAVKKVEWTERDPNNTAQPPRVVTADIEGPTQDIISAIYFLRTVPFTPGHTFNLAVSDSGRVYNIPGTVTNERKKMKTVLGKVSVVRVDVDIFGPGRPVEGKGKMSLWVTDDESRIPVKARLSHDMGQLDITLKSVQK